MTQADTLLNEQEGGHMIPVLASPFVWRSYQANATARNSPAQTAKVGMLNVLGQDRLCGIVMSVREEAAVGRVYIEMCHLASGSIYASLSLPREVYVCVFLSRALLLDHSFLLCAQVKLRIRFLLSLPHTLHVYASL